MTTRSFRPSRTRVDGAGRLVSLLIDTVETAVGFRASSERARSDWESLAGTMPLAVSPAPHRDPCLPVNLPATVAPDERRAFVDSENGGIGWRLERHQRGEGLRPGVVVREDRCASHEPERDLPAEWPGQHHPPEVDLSLGEHHRAGRAPGQHRAALVR